MPSLNSAIRNKNAHLVDGLSRWIDELALLLPQRTRRSWQGLLLATPDGLELYLPDAGGSGRLSGLLKADRGSWTIDPADQARVAKLARNPSGLILRLRHQDVIEKTIAVPAEAEDVIAPIARNHIEMISPWPVDKALYDWRIEPQSRPSRSAGSQLNLVMAISGKAVIERWLAVAGRHGLKPAIVDFGDHATPATGLNFLRERHLEPVRGRGFVQALLILLIIGALASASFGLLKALEQHKLLVSVEERTSIAKHRADLAREVANKAARLEARYQLARDEKRRNAPLIAVIEELSRVLPDGTWLRRLEIRESSIRIAGQSSDATALIDLLETSPFFSGVRFSAPVTPGDGGQQFAIEAKAPEHLDVVTLLKPVAAERALATPTIIHRQPMANE